ncbi:MAG: hypothetical protein ABIZ04_10350 [Opitutus sp.]
MIEETKREVTIHRLNPEGQTGEFDGEGIKVYAIKAAFHDEALEPGSDGALGGSEVTGKVAHAFAKPRRLSLRESRSGAKGANGLIGYQPLVMKQATPERFGQIAESGNGKRR